MNYLYATLTISSNILNYVQYAAKLEPHACLVHGIQVWLKIKNELIVHLNLLTLNVQKIMKIHSVIPDF